MRLEWDINKNIQNIEKHGFDFTDAHELFEQPICVRRDARKDYGEIRYQAIGFIRKRLVVIIFTECEDHIRIISLRRANGREEKAFKEAFQN